jgi:hypothetical protein
VTAASVDAAVVAGYGCALSLLFLLLRRDFFPMAEAVVFM